MFNGKRQILAGLIGVFVFLAQVSAAPLPCVPDGATPISLSRIELDGTLITRQGQRLRLAGLAWPDALEPARQTMLKATLEKALAQDTLSIKPAAPPDRWGTQGVYLFVAEAGTNTTPFWLQAGLAEAGLAPAWPDIAAACWRELLPFEAAARRAKRGFWAPRAQAARHRAVLADPSRHAGRQMVARWRVLSVRKSEVMTYVNIAPFFRVGPSIALSGKDVRDMLQAGRDPMRLSGKMVLARFISAPSGLSRVRLAPGQGLVEDHE